MSSKGTEPESSGPFDELVDAAIFAPLGLALEYRKLMPELAETGRKQVAFARTLGRAALSTMASAASKKAASSAGAKPTSPAAPAASAESSKAAAAAASIDGYDTMTAKDIIARAATATPAELAWMTEREQAGKRRKTVLAKLAQLSD